MCALEWRRLRSVLLRPEPHPGQNRCPGAHCSGASFQRRLRSRTSGQLERVSTTHPGQFEPWTTRQREIEELSPDDPCYQSAAIIADAVLSGQTPDPTAGATHFLNLTIVRERRGGALPSWAAGEELTIGSHTFYFLKRAMPHRSLRQGSLRVAQRANSHPPGGDLISPPLNEC